MQHLASSPMQYFQKRRLTLSKFSEKSSAPSSKYDATPKEEENMERKDNSENSENRKIFIGNLLRGRNYTSEDKLHKYFSQYGEIEALECPRTKISNLSRGFAFVTYRDVESVHRVLAESHFIDGRNVKIEAALQKNVANQKRDLTVRVTNIMKDINKETIARHFSQFGKVDRVILAEEGENERKSYYVLFSTLSGATKAQEEPIQRIAEQSIDSQVMALVKIPPVTTMYPGRTNCLTITCTSVPDNLTVEDLRDYFQQYGDVQYVDFIVQGGKRSYLQRDSNTAFVRFRDEAIIDKIVTMKDHVINGSGIQVSRYRDLHKMYLPPEKARELRLAVEGLPPVTLPEEVNKYFEETFGIVLNGVFFTKKMIWIVRFSNQADLEKVLREPKASFHGFPLYFRRLAWKK